MYNKSLTEEDSSRINAVGVETEPLPQCMHWTTSLTHYPSATAPDRLWEMNPLYCIVLYSGLRRHILPFPDLRVLAIRDRIFLNLVNKKLSLSVYDLSMFRQISCWPWNWIYEQDDGQKQYVIMIELILIRLLVK